MGSLRHGFVYNFWQDAKNPKGLWRRTTIADYQNAEPEMGGAAGCRCAGQGGKGELGLQGRRMRARAKPAA